VIGASAGEAVELARGLGPPGSGTAERAASLFSVGDPSPADLATAVACIDLTTLEGDDTSETVRALAARALDPAGDGSVGHVAAVCIYPRFVRDAAAVVAGSGVVVASVAGAFPSGHAVPQIKVAEIERAVADGADEVDVVLPYAELEAGREDDVASELLAMRGAAGGARLKVILETGWWPAEAGSIRRAATLALACGADMIKTSTGKIAVGATPEAAATMAESIEDFARATGKKAGLKVAGGIRTPREAAGYMAIARAFLGSDAVSPARFRIGASSLLAPLVEALSR
jgi:deoxyribose-phosphate aldolase